MATTTASALQARLTDGSLTGEWVLDPGRSVIGLKSKALWGLAPVKGAFRQISGNGTVAPGGQVTGTITVAAASIDTRNKRRDKHLRSADFFDSNNYANITFAMDHVLLSEQAVTMAGTLTVRDRTRPLEVDAAASIQDENEIWLDAEIQIDRTDFGLDWNRLGAVSNENTLTIHAAFTRQ